MAETEEQTDHDVTTLDGLRAAVQLHAPETQHNFAIVTGTHCPQCGDDRRLVLSALLWTNRWTPQKIHRRQLGVVLEGQGGVPPLSEYPADSEPDPAVYSAVCLQCEHVYLLVVHSGPDGLELAALPSSYGGLATPKTPDPVAYYLDQANRARSVGALSAAAAMYRAALDQLLFHEGYEKGTLGVKIRELEAADPAPSWYTNLDPAYLEVINWIGSGAIHPNDGNVDHQKVIDRDITEAVDALFTEILDLVYERPDQRKARLSTVRRVAEQLKRDAPNIGKEKPET